MLAIADGDGDLQLLDSLDNPGLVHRRGGDVAVRPNEAARAQLNSAKVTGDHGDNVMQLCHLQGFEDRNARRTTGFAIIAFPLNLVLVAHEVCEAVMVGFAIGRLDFFNKLLGRLFTADPLEGADEAGLFNC